MKADENENIEPCETSTFSAANERLVVRSV